MSEVAPESIEGTVERTVYHDARTRYTVLRVLVPGHTELVTAVGRTDGVENGAGVTLRGKWDDHPTHGRQFAFAALQTEVPTTPAGIQRRLTRYPGIGDRVAERIVSRFGLDTLEILDQQPGRLLEVSGIGQNKLDAIIAHHKTTHGPIAKIEAQLLELDLPPHLADPIHSRYGDEALVVLQKRPYRLARDVRGIGFVTADRIARALGVAVDSSERVEAGILHAVERAESEGHCALPADRLLQVAQTILEVDAERVRSGFDSLELTGDLVVEQHSGGPLCFPHRFVVAEESVARSLTGLALAPRHPWEVPVMPEHLSEGQVDAVRAAANAGVVVLTGGPGTGKSTVVRTVLELARANGTDLLLAAPTGRAAKRLEQATGEHAKTVHRLLEVEGDTGRFVHGAGNPLPPGLVVIDESSMLDIGLAAALFDALTSEHRLLLVGDADQLPSVGPGNVLRDVIGAAQESGMNIPVVRLTQIFRQTEGSSIVVNAHRILAGRAPEADEPGRDGEFFVVRTRESERAHELVVRMATERIPEVYGFDPRTEVQVLCPMHKGRTGTVAFNQALQNHHTSGHREIRAGSRASPKLFRVGDRVMQTRNDYNKGVFNGDVGVVGKVDPGQASLVVDMDGVRVPYEGREIGALQLAYAVSIHKSQGSEFPAVIVPILGEHHIMLRRNLLYTAVTRARQLCVLVGDPRAIERAVMKSDAAHRFTGLRQRLRSALGATWVDVSESV